MNKPDDQWSTNGTFIWVTSDKALINKAGHLLSFESAIGSDEGSKGREARARRIVTAVNCHKELVEALEWYGEQARLARLIHSGGDKGRHALAGDGGERARTALAKAREVGK